MSTGPVAAEEAAQPLDEGIPFGAKLQQLAEQRCGDTALTVIARDGMGRSMTFAEAALKVDPQPGAVSTTTLPVPGSNRSNSGNAPASTQFASSASAW